MRVAPDFPLCLPAADPSGIKIAVIYEDFLSGARARNFAQCLAAALDCTCALDESFWRSALLDYPAIAEQALRASVGSEYLIVSLRGDSLLSLATRQWIEAHLEGARGNELGLIFLSDAAHGQRRVLEGTRHYLRTACAAHGVAFFSHATTPLPEKSRGRAAEPQTPVRLAPPSPLWSGLLTA